MATFALIFTTTILLLVVGVLIIVLCRSCRKFERHEQPAELNIEAVKNAPEVTASIYTEEESRTSPARTNQIPQKTTDVEETPKNRPKAAPAKRDVSPAIRLHVPIAGYSATPTSHWSVAVDRTNRVQVSRRTSIVYENSNLAAILPVQILPPTKINTRQVSPKPKPKSTDPTPMGPLKSPDYLELCNGDSPFERPASPFVNAASNETTVSVTQRATGNNKTQRKRGNNDQKMLQRSIDIKFSLGGEIVRHGNATNDRRQRKDKFAIDSDGYLQTEDDEQGTTSSERKKHLPIPANRNGSGYVNGSEVSKYEKGKVATHSDDYLQPEDFEQASASSETKEHLSSPPNRDTSGYVNGSELSTSNPNCANKGRIAKAKKEGKLTDKFRGRKQRSRPMNPVNPTTFASAFRKYSFGRHGSGDRGNSPGERGSKSSSHSYVEIALACNDNDEGSVSTTKLSEAPPTKKVRSKLRKKLSAKKWSQNEDAVGY